MPRLRSHLQGPYRLFHAFFLAATSVLCESTPLQPGPRLKSDGASIRHQHRRRAVWHSPFSYFLRCLLRIMEKYIAAKAASSTPPNIRIKVVIICSPISTSKIKVARVQQTICSPKTRRSRCRLIPLRHRSLLTSRPVRSLPLWLTVLAITDLSFPGATLLTPPPLCCIQCGGATRIPAGRGNNPHSWCSV